MLGLSADETERHSLLQRFDTEERARNDGRPWMVMDSLERPMLVPNQPERIGDNRPGYCGHMKDPPNDTIVETFSNIAGLEEVHKSALNLCHLCILLHHAATTHRDERCLFYDTGYLQLMVKYPSLGSTCGNGLVQTAGHLYCPVDTQGEMSLIISQPGRDHNPSARNNMTLADSAQLSQSTASDSHLQLARRWLGDCEKSHERCRQYLKSSCALPTRLLVLGPQRGSRMIRLCDTKSLKEHPRYVTLSHCWGGIKPLALTKSTEAMLSKGFDWSNLPPTFKDAAWVTLQLGFRYLWIDSLCIMQDSAEDWESESSIMGQIYIGCALNISALWARNCNDGLFVQREPLLYRPCALTTKSWRCEEIGTWACSLDPRAEYEHERSLLGSRGWVVQERMLSPRTLHYGPHSISWECRLGDAGEDHPYFSSSSYYETIRPKQELVKIGNSFTYMGWDTKVKNMSDDVLRLYSKWITIVHFYTGCSLTHSEDTLVAINGIVGIISQITRLSNIAGLWRESIILELMWIAEDQTKVSIARVARSASATQPYLAPTWSWASLGRQVEFAITPEKNQRSSRDAPNWFDVEIDLVAECLNAAAHALLNGFLMSAFADIRGLVRKALPYDQPNPNCFVGDREQIDPFIAPQPTAPPPNRWLWDHPPPTPEEVWVVLLARGTGHVTHWKQCTRADQCRSDMGLILEFASDKQGSLRAFRRLGFFEQFHLPGDTYQLFAPGKGGELETIRII